MTTLSEAYGNYLGDPDFINQMDEEDFRFHYELMKNVPELRFPDDAEHEVCVTQNRREYSVFWLDGEVIGEYDEFDAKELWSALTEKIPPPARLMVSFSRAVEQP